MFNNKHKIKGINGRNLNVKKITVRKALYLITKKEKVINLAEASTLLNLVQPFLCHALISNHIQLPLKSSQSMEIIKIQNLIIRKLSLFLKIPGRNLQIKKISLMADSLCIRRNKRWRVKIWYFDYGISILDFLIWYSLIF